MRIVDSQEPRIVGTFDIDCKEMMFVQDIPVGMPGTGIRLPPHLQCFEPLITAAINDAGFERVMQYVYLSAKRLFVSPESNYNRLGWHIDGYGTDDLNYLWYDAYPTEFCVGEFTLSEDPMKAIKELECASLYAERIVTYRNHRLIRMDNTNVHRVGPVGVPGIRTFAKVSISERKFNREGNAHNYLFDYDWEMVARSLDRNVPAAE